MGSRGPDPKYAETILAIPRAYSDTKISLQERKVGQVPSIVFEQEDGKHGSNKQLILVQTSQITEATSKIMVGSIVTSLPPLIFLFY
ncbi:hypothetical protein ACOSP7_018659 [Xanthoceras sorbifolium]